MVLQYVIDRMARQLERRKITVHWRSICQLITSENGQQQAQAVHKGYSQLHRLVFGEGHGPAFNSSVSYMITICEEFWKHKLPISIDLRNETIVTPNLTLDVVHAGHTLSELAG